MYMTSNIIRYSDGVINRIWDFNSMHGIKIFMTAILIPSWNICYSLKSLAHDEVDNSHTHQRKGEIKAWSLRYSCHFKPILLGHQLHVQSI